MDGIMIIITSLGNGGAIWIAAALLFVSLKKYRKLGAAIILSLLIAFLVGDVIMKPLIRRDRPFVNGTQTSILANLPTDYSFPSGHTFSSFAAATVIFCYKKRWGSYAVILASLIAFSRIYLGVHYPTDVLAGIVLGIGTGIASYKICEVIL